MSERPSAEKDALRDGFCPRCGALADQFCQRPDGSARSDHAERHAYPASVIPPGSPRASGEGSGVERARRAMTSDEAREVLAQIDDEHETTRYCREGVCAVCSIISRLNDAFAGDQGHERVGTLGDDETCRRCGQENVTWAAPSPLWNLVMRGNDINAETQYADLVCIRCFIVLAEVAGIRGQWRVYVTPEPEGLLFETPSGRVWNDETWLWEMPESPREGETA